MLITSTHWECYSIFTENSNGNIEWSIFFQEYVKTFKMIAYEECRQTDTRRWSIDTVRVKETE